MKPVSLMTEEERIQEIAEILANEALRLIRKEDRERTEPTNPSHTPMEVWDLVDDELEKQVLRYLALNVGGTNFKRASQGARFSLATC